MRTDQYEFDNGRRRNKVDDEISKPKQDKKARKRHEDGPMVVPEKSNIVETSQGENALVGFGANAVYSLHGLGAGESIETLKRLGPAPQKLQNLKPQVKNKNTRRSIQRRRVFEIEVEMRARATIREWSGGLMRVVASQ
jgi:hypothetical protein